MANIISLADYQGFWREHNQNTKQPDPSDSSDLINICPKQFGTGYERWIELRHISLLIIDAEFHYDLVIEKNSLDGFIGGLEFGFHLLGYWNNINAGKNFFQSGAVHPSKQPELLRSQRLLKVDIHLESLELIHGFIAGSLNPIAPYILEKLINPTQKPYFQIDYTTPEMRVALEQIINCPFTGLTKKLYLESKCLELIALKLEQLAASENSSTKVTILKGDDIDRIHYAKEILAQNLDNPPSLIELARQVGLNDYKLKLGFRQVFGTTAFSYLHQQRMEKARQLLLEGQMNVKEVARAVGYTNQSHFATAFRKQFGTNPKSYDLLLRA
ncbi:helix-turn-helix transcriptional regulator [Tolypothrix sp. FACHB-123]|uniref:helix-turn-helix transcriptional regulator n=1 Tax=Tolypothrix sp. FACHB-123 TaxID=2692868 RepID=UPI00168503A3|nr:AraC family transcriptional regulator [Tolypothrix sp. FACHB-123]MBD2355418.1 helix-turn-helix transcriptional regulator [Tolypothrix sp. FACHB-123]